jgi:predicted dehydrogenase
MTVAALRAGKHVVVEKPMALNLREADRMIGAARKARKLLTIHPSRRHASDTLYIQEVIESGLLGEVFFIRMAGYGFARRADWQMLRKLGGGMLNNWGSHVVDQALMLLRRPVREVFADLRHTVGAGDAEDHVKIILRADKGPTIDIELTNACAIPMPDWVLMGTCGTLLSQGGTSKIRYFDPKGLPKLKASEVLTHRRYGTDEKLPWQEKEEATKSSRTVDFYDNLYGAIRHRKKLLITPQSVRELIRVLDLCRKSAGL